MSDIPCNPEQYNCPLRESGCFEDTHHKFFPRAAYKGVLELAFRDLPENLVEGCRYWHNLEHAVVEPPEKPDQVTMSLAVIEADNRGEVYVSRRLQKVIEKVLIDDLD